jgi:hypothetical protein
VPKAKLSEEEQQKQALEDQRQELLETAKAINEDLRAEGERLNELRRQPRSEARDREIEEVQEQIKLSKTHQGHNSAALERNAAAKKEASIPFPKKVENAVNADSDYQKFRARAQDARIDKVTDEKITAKQSIEIDHLISKDEVSKKPGVKHLDRRL